MTASGTRLLLPRFEDLVPFLYVKTSCRNADPATMIDGSVSDDERVLEVGDSVLSRSPLAKLYMQ